ncbi:terminase large subunit [Vibrio fortis]|uniref:terminase large subunit n=1 Tax=Vibrio fortis TaxID=212667 RepID=UPI0038CD6476
MYEPPKKYRYKTLKFTEQSHKQIHKYCYDVLTGNVVANKWIKLAATRHFKDLEKSKQKNFKYKFVPELAQRAIDFYQFTSHAKGDLKGQPLQLMPWQQFIVGSIFGWVKKEKNKQTGRYNRRFRTAEVFVGRKNGKSTLASGIALYMMLMDGEGGPEIYTAARAADQARIVYGDALEMVRSGELNQLVKAYRSEIRCELNNGIFKAVAAEAANLEGKNIHCGVIDEIHVHPNSEVLDVIASGCGARSQSLIFIISTAGTILDGVAVDQWKYGESVLQELHTDDSYFAALYCIDDGDDFTDSKNWVKANPCVGVSFPHSYLENELQQAMEITSKRANFLTKFCNKFVNSADAWLDVDQVRKCKADINLQDYKGKQCYIGLDLAQKLDLTAMSLIFPQEDGLIDVFFKHYMPEDALANCTTQSRQQYEKWSQNSYLELTPGVATDFSIIEDDLRSFSKQFDVVSIGYDPYAATQMSFKLTEEGLPMVAVSQVMKNLSEPAKEFEQLIATERLRYNGDQVFESCCANAYVIVDTNENIKPVKENKMSKDKIDSVIALITGLSLCILAEPPKKSVYATRGMRFL